MGTLCSPVTLTPPPKGPNHPPSTAPSCEGICREIVEAGAVVLATHPVHPSFSPFQYPVSELLVQYARHAWYCNDMPLLVDHAAPFSGCVLVVWAVERDEMD